MGALADVEGRAHIDSQYLLLVNHFSEYTGSNRQRHSIRAHVRNHAPGHQRAAWRFRNRVPGQSRIVLLKDDGIASGRTSRRSDANTVYRYKRRRPPHKPSRATAPEPQHKNFPDSYRPRGPSSEAPTPQTIYQGGNSDPFDALVIPVDAVINQLLGFCREWYLPNLHRDATIHLPNMVNKQWSTCVTALGDQLAAHSLLLRVATALSSTLKVDTAKTASLELHRKCLTGLKGRLAESDAFSKPSTVEAISALLRAALYKYDFPQALSHSKILSHLLQTGIAKSDIDLKFYAIMYDYQRSLLTLSRPCFDYTWWVPDTFAERWSRFTEQLPPSVLLDQFESSIDSSIHDSAWRQVLTQIRHLCAVQTLARKELKYDTMEKVFYLRSFYIYLMGKLLNIYLDHCPGRVIPYPTNESASGQICQVSSALYNMSLVTHDSAIPSRVQAFMALAATYWTRTVVRAEWRHTQHQTYVFAAKDWVLTTLKQTMASWDAEATKPQRIRYARARLWALHVGAQAEWSAGQDPSSVAEGESVRKDTLFFSPRFARQAQALGLQSWRAVREELEGGFLYSDLDVFGLHGSEWFWRTLTSS